MVDNSPYIRACMVSAILQLRDTLVPNAVILGCSVEFIEGHICYDLSCWDARKFKATPIQWKALYLVAAGRELLKRWNEYGPESRELVDEFRRLERELEIPPRDLSYRNSLAAQKPRKPRSSTALYKEALLAGATNWQAVLKYLEVRGHIKWDGRGVLFIASNKRQPLCTVKSAISRAKNCG
jgi:hypothetical protein